MGCCPSWVNNYKLGNLKKKSLKEIWNDTPMKQLRVNMLTEQPSPACVRCYEQEASGFFSGRKSANKHQGHQIHRVLETKPDGELERFEMTYWDIRFSNLCNLKCRMCHPMDSTSWNDWKEVEPFYEKEGNFMVKAIKDLNLVNKPYLDKFEDNLGWWESFEKLLPYFRRVEFAGGEPLMDPQHYKILDMLKSYGANIEIKYATNGTTLGIKGGRTIHDYWPHFRSVAVNVSIDGIGDSYSYIRGNGDYQDVVDNLSIIKQIPNVRRIVGAVAVQVSNILILDKMIEEFLDKLGIIFYTNMVNYPNALCPQVLPQELKELAIERLEQVKLRVPNFKLVKDQPALLDITLGQIQGVINFLKAKDQHDKWQDCIEFNRKLDVTRKQNFTDVTPEFKSYV